MMTSSWLPRAALSLQRDRCDQATAAGRQREPQSHRQPGLLGWVALLLDPASGLALITMLLWACLAVDRVFYPRYQMQAWLPMRLWLTLTASSSCLVAAIALQR
jgi:hypothetical protein